MSKVAVMGSGSWGTAFAAMCCDAGEPTVLWARREEVAAEIPDRHTNAAYLPDIELPPSLTATTDAEEALARRRRRRAGRPVGRHQRPARGLGRADRPDATLASLIKGVDVDTMRFGSQVIADTPRLRPGPGGRRQRPEPGQGVRRSGNRPRPSPHRLTPAAPNGSRRR